MTNDRNYLRMLSDSELIRLAIDSYNETSIVLAERLSALLDVQEHLENITNERDEIDARCDIWKQQAIEAMDELDALRGVK
jgi:hypothetical protein